MRNMIPDMQVPLVGRSACSSQISPPNHLMCCRLATMLAKHQAEMERPRWWRSASKQKRTVYHVGGSKQTEDRARFLAMECIPVALQIYKQGVVESERGRRVRVGIRRGESYLHGKMLHQIFCDVSFVCFLLVSACIC